MMRRAIVTVRCGEIPYALDLEVPVDVDSAGVARAAARGFGVEGEFALEVFPLGRLLAPTETLAEAGAWDGAWLLLHPVKA